MNRVSMKQVAEAAGVSKNTVSLALRSSPLVKGATREKIIEAARSLGYSLNPAMSKLMSEVSLHPGKRHYLRLAFLNHFHHSLDNETHPPLHAFFQGAHDQAIAMGYHFQEFQRPSTEQERQARDRQIWAMGFDGAVIFPFEEGHGSVDFSTLQIPKVAIGFTWNGTGVPRVACDYFGNVLRLYRIACEKGYRRIGLLMTPDMNKRTSLRVSGGFLAAQREAACSIELPIIMHDRQSPGDLLAEAAGLSCDCLLVGATFHPHLPEELLRSKSIALASYSLSPEQIKLGISGMDECCEKVGRTALHILASTIQQSQLDGLAELSVRVPGEFREGPSLPPAQHHSAKAKSRLPGKGLEGVLNH
jgi:LacI family transcriptional regulator